MSSSVTEAKDEVGNSYFELFAPSEVRYRVITTSYVFDKTNAILAKYLDRQKVLVCLDRTIQTLYGGVIHDYLSSKGIVHSVVVVPSGELNKNIESVVEICRSAEKFGMERRSIFLAVGGGITLDTVGFAAQIYRRMLPYIRVPTTLVGLVDAGVGIKVGVNFAGHKNLIGSFYPPSVVLNDESFLSTLNSRQLRCGLFEMIKIATVRNKRLFELIEACSTDVLRGNFNKHVSKVINLSIKEMLKELQPNIYEHNLKRLSDFGHFFGAILEPLSHYQLAHGEAVALDMLISTRIAHARGVCSAETLDRISGLIEQTGLPLFHPLCTPAAIWNSLPIVIAHRGGKPNLVLPETIGKGVYTDRLSLAELEAAMDGDS